MSLLSQLEADLKQALLTKDKDTANLLRLIKAALKNEMIALKKQELSDEEVIKVLKREAKKRQDSIKQFTQGGRQDLADQEKKELAILEKYLPQQLPPEEIKKVIQEVINGMGEVSPSQFGAVMGAVMKKIGSQADGNVVSQLVKEALSHQ